MWCKSNYIYAFCWVTEYEKLLLCFVYFDRNYVFILIALGQAFVADNFYHWKILGNIRVTCKQNSKGRRRRETGEYTEGLFTVLFSSVHLLPCLQETVR